MRIFFVVLTDGHIVFESRSARPLDLHPTSPDNGHVRVRPLLILLAFVALAFAGLRQEGPPAPEPQSHTPAQGALNAPPAPDADLPATLTAAVKGSAYVQTEPAAIDAPLLRPEPVSTAAPHIARAIPDRTARPLTFPLLI